MATTGSSDKATVELVKDALQCSYNYVSRDWNGRGSPFEVAQRCAMAYEQVFDVRTWPTTSELYMPFARISVDVLLPNVMWYIFSNEELFDLIPMDTEVTEAQAIHVRNFLHYRMRTGMELWRKAYPTIKDAAKLGVGYGTLEMQAVTPMEFATVRTEETSLEVRTMQRATKPEYVPAYRYIRFGRILPSPGGGAQPDERDWVIHIDHVSEHDLRSMMEDDDNPVEGEIGAIREDTLRSNIDGKVLSVYGLLQNLTKEGASTARADLIEFPRGRESSLPVQIPVIKYYGKNHHVWLANGKTVIFEQENTVHTLRNPILKASISLDGDEWYSNGIIADSEDMFMGTNVMYNTVMDIVDMVSRPRMIRDRSVITGELDMSPWGVTDSYGPAVNALQFLQPPGLRPEVIQMIGELRSVMQQSTGHSEQLHGIGATGVMRGGSSAFESLMASTGARDKLAANVMDMGFMKPMIEGVLLLEQLSIELGQIRSFQVTDDNGVDATHRNNTITYEDLRNMFRVDISLREKLRNSMADANMRFAVYSGITQDPTMRREVNPVRLLEYLVGDSFAVRRLRNGADPEAADRVFEYYAAMQSKTNGQGRLASPGAGGAGGDAAQAIQAGGATF